MPRLVHYSLSFLADTPRPDIVEQFATSVGTLRQHNADVPVALFTWGGITVDLAAICREFDVHVHEQGSYASRLAALCPTGWPALARYPLLHKFLNFRELAQTGAAQILYCDCDTLFLDDVEILFDRYASADVVAREEVHSSRSPYGIDRSFIDEPLLARLAGERRRRVIAPINLGVVLFNNLVVATTRDGTGRALLRLRLALCLLDGDEPPRRPGSGDGRVSGCDGGVAAAGAHDAARALPFPSANRWILDEVALWLALGHVPGLRTADFHPRDVAQNGEYATTIDPASAGWVVCHYFSQNLRRIDAWRRHSAGRPA